MIVSKRDPGTHRHAHDGIHANGVPLEGTEELRRMGEAEVEEETLRRVLVYRLKVETGGKLSYREPLQDRTPLGRVLFLRVLRLPSWTEGDRRWLREEFDHVKEAKRRCLRLAG